MSFLTTKEEITDWLNQYDVQNFTINEDLTVDVDGGVDLGHLVSLDGKIPVQFGIVSGNFWCQGSDLTTLSGSPKEVGGHFVCAGNKLTTLHGSPNKVAGKFLCQSSGLTSLHGAPENVGQDFKCSNNDLISLDGAPKKVGGLFNCSNNRLTSLNGAPKEVGETFACDTNFLLTLDGAPDKIGEDFLCRRNPLKAFGEIATQFDGDFACDRFDELVIFQSTTDEEGYLWVSSKELNPYIQQLKLIREEKALLEATVIKATQSIDIGSSKPGAAVEQIRKARSEQGLTLAPVKAQPSTQPTQAKPQQRTFKI